MAVIGDFGSSPESREGKGGIWEIQLKGSTFAHLDFLHFYFVETMRTIGVYMNIHQNFTVKLLVRSPDEPRRPAPVLVDQ